MTDVHAGDQSLTTEEVTQRFRALATPSHVRLRAGPLLSLFSRPLSAARARFVLLGQLRQQCAKTCCLRISSVQIGTNDVQILTMQLTSPACAGSEVQVGAYFSGMLYLTASRWFFKFKFQ